MVERCGTSRSMNNSCAANSSHGMRLRQSSSVRTLKNSHMLGSDSRSQIVHLREGAIREVDGILERSGARRIFLVIDENAYSLSGADKTIEPSLVGRSVTRFSNFEENPKLHDVEKGVSLYKEHNPDIILAIGGGTAIDMGKLIRAVGCADESAHSIVTGSAKVARVRQPLVAVPTTSGTGSEATQFAVVYVDQEKYSIDDSSLLPEYAVVDPLLTHSLPPKITAATGLDAFCQAVESIWAVGASQESIAYASEAITLSLQNLANATCDSTGSASRARMALARAAHLSGKAINISRTTASHALSYVITSQHDVPHGIAVALTLSPMLAYNSKVVAEDCADPRGPRDVLERIDLLLRLLDAASVSEACVKIEAMISELGCPSSLQQAGITSAEDIREIVDNVNLVRLSNNPRRATADALFQLLTNDSRSSQLEGPAARVEEMT